MTNNKKSNYLNVIMSKLKQVMEDDIHPWHEYIQGKYAVRIENANYEKNIYIPRIRLNRIINESDRRKSFDNYIDEQIYPYIYIDTHIEICICTPFYVPFTGSIVIRKVKKGKCLDDVDEVTKVCSQPCWFFYNRIFFDKRKLMNELTIFVKGMRFEIGV
jgi:hypothetical protein